MNRSRARSLWQVLLAALALVGLSAHALELAIPKASDRPQLEASLAEASGLQRATLLYQLTEIDRTSAPQTCLELGREALAILEPLPDEMARELRALVLANVAWAHAVLGDYVQAQQQAEAGAIAARDIHSAAAESRNHNTLGFIAVQVGDFEAALGYFQQTYLIEDALGNAHRKAQALSNLGGVLIRLRRYDDAFTMLREAEQLARTLGIERIQAYARINLSEAYIKVGEYAQAIDWLARADEAKSQRDQADTASLILQNRGVALAGLQRVDEAKQALLDALELRTRIGDEAGQCGTHSELARLAIQTRAPAEARRHLDAALAKCQRIGNRFLMQDVLEVQALLAEANGDLAGALHWTRQRDSLARELFSDRAALRIGQFQNRLSLSQREHLIAALTRENEIQQLQVRQQWTVLWAVAVAAVLLAVIAVLIFFRLRQRRAAAENAAEARSRFLAHMSHEIRTPMTGIIGVTELLQESPLTPDQQELLGTIRQSGETLLNLVNDILDMSKLDAGRLPLNVEEFDLRELLESVLDSFGLPAEQKQLSLLYQLPLDAPVQVSGDALRLRQLLLNLIGNAVKFTERGHVRVLANWLPGSGPMRRLELAIEDTGIGIAADHLQHVFEPFAQGSVDVRSNVGTGLGLTISRQLARLMGGDVAVSSEPGRGSRFVVQVQLRVLDSTVPTLAAMSLPPVFLLRTPAVLTEQLESLLAAVSVRPVAVADAALPALVAAKPKLLVVPAAPDLADWLPALQQQLPALRVIVLAGPKARQALQEQRQPGLMVVGLPLRPAEFLSALVSVATSVPVPQPATVSARVPVPTTALASVSGLARALVVDDNEINRRVAQKMLERLGFAVLTLDNGKTAVELLARQSFEVVFMDCQMPELDGFAATRAIREQEQASGRRQLIIAMTAHALKGDREQCLAAGMDDYLTKPVKLDVLGSTLKRWHLAVEAVQRV